MSHKPDYEEIARLEVELGIVEAPAQPKPTPPPTPPPPPKKNVVDLAAYVAHKRRLEGMTFYPGQVWQVSASAAPAYNYSQVISGAKLRTVTIYGPDGKPLYDTPAS